MATPAPVPATRRRAPARPRTRSTVSETATPRPLPPDSVGLSAVTVEGALFALLVVLAAAIRLWDLGAMPLSPREAAVAASSFRFGEIAPPADVGAFLRHGGTFAMSVLGATDFTARLIPAIVGSLIPLAAFLLRPLVGRTVAVLSACLLTVSPMLIDQSRFVGNGAIAATLALASFALLLRLRERPVARDLYLAAAVVGMLFVAGPVAFDFALVFAGLAAWLWSRGGLVSTQHAETEPPAKGEYDPASSPLTVATFPTSTWQRAGVILALTVVVLGTGGFTNLAGLDETISASIGAWFGGFANSADWPMVATALVLLGYEPLLLIGGLAGLVVGLRDDDLVARLLGGWAALGIVLATLRPGRQPEDALLYVVPLAVLTAMASAHLIARLLEMRPWRELGAVFLGGVILVGLQFYVLSHVTTPVPFVPDWFGALPALLIGVLYVGLRSWIGVERANTTSAAVGLIVLLGFTIHSAWNLAYISIGNTNQITHHQQTTPDVRSLVDDVDDVLDVLTVNRKPSEVVVVEQWASPLRWYLRPFKSVRTEPRVAGSPSIAIVGIDEKAPVGSYAGQRYLITLTGWPNLSTLSEAWRWWAFRGRAEPEPGEVNLFVKAQ